MNKRPGHVVVTTEVGFCSFCGRPRNLRREAHQLGTLVRTIVTCEVCHRTLSSTVGLASADSVEPETERVAKEPEPTPEVAAAPTAPKTAAKPAAPRQARATAKPPAPKSAAKAKKKSG